MSTTMHAFLLVVVAAAVTIGIRALPFFIFDHGQEPPKWVTYLGGVLPPAVMSVLVLYCIRNIDLMSGNHGIPDILCLLVTMGLHAWKRNTLLSICVGTALYMILIQAMV